MWQLNTKAAVVVVVVMIAAAALVASNVIQRREKISDFVTSLPLVIGLSRWLLSVYILC